MAEMVLKGIALVVQRVERLMFNAPTGARPLQDTGHGALVDAAGCAPPAMLDFALHRLPACEAMDPQRGIERHGTHTAQPLAPPLGAVLTRIIGDATGSCRLGHALEPKRVLPCVDAQHLAQGMHVSRLKMRGIRTEAISGDNHFEGRVLPAKLGDKTFGRVALAGILLGAILLDNRLGHQRNDCALVGVQQGRT
jgi:hypothetical protein